MSDTVIEITPLRAARDALDLSRERVAGQLDPPISSKTLERWEQRGTAPGWRLRQLAEVYGCEVATLEVAA